VYPESLDQQVRENVWPSHMRFVRKPIKLVHVGALDLQSLTWRSPLMRKILRPSLTHKYIAQILEDDFDDEVVPGILRGSQRVKFLEPLRLKFVA
jgi:hypothetical protein